MALNLDPQTPVERDIGGVTYLLRVLTQREMARFSVHSEAIRARIRATPADQPAVLDEDDVRRLERCLQIGVAGWSMPAFGDSLLPPWRSSPEGKRVMDAALLDAIPFGVWMELYAAVIEANTVTEADSKNSPSPPQ